MGLGEVPRVAGTSADQFTVWLHASLKDVAGAETVRLSVDGVPGGVTVSHLKRCLEAACPRIQGLLAQCRWAVDLELVGDDHPLQDGQRVDVLPPFSGG